MNPTTEEEALQEYGKRLWNNSCFNDQPEIEEVLRGMLEADLSGGASLGIGVHYIATNIVKGWDGAKEAYRQHLAIRNPQQVGS